MKKIFTICEEEKEEELNLDDLYEKYDDLLKIDGFDGAIIGVGERCSQEPLLIYDYNKIIEILMKDMPYEEAVDHCSFNIAGAWMGNQTPIILFKD